MRPLRKLCRELEVTASFAPIERRPDAEFGKDARHYLATLRFQGRALQTEFSIGYKVKEPIVEDVVASLVLDASAGRDSFEDYCSNFGADEDSRKAYATWEACKKTAADVAELFGLHLQTFEEAAADW